MDLMFQPLRKYADFAGRARRKEYWFFTLFVSGISLAVALPAELRGDGELPLLISVPFGIVLLGLLLPSLAVGVRRLHDTNRSGWWLLISLVPILGGIVCFVFMVLPGTRGPNKYGPDPIDPLVVAEVIT